MGYVGSTWKNSYTFSKLIYIRVILSIYPIFRRNQCMRYKKPIKLLTCSIIVMLFFSIFVNVAGTFSATDSDMLEERKDTDGTMAADPELTASSNMVDEEGGIDIEWRNKLDYELRSEIDNVNLNKKMPCCKYVTVMVTTQNPGKLHRFLRDVGGTIHIDSDLVSYKNFDYSSLSYKDNIGKVVTREIDIPISSLDSLAKLDEVYHVFNKPEIKTMSDNDKVRDYYSGSNKYPVSNKTLVQSHGAVGAWDLGYNGTGTNIGIVDTGTDFAHADLVDQWAVAPSGDYSGAGWPVMFNQGSMNLYLTTNQTGVNRTIYGGYPVGFEAGTDSRYSQTNFTFAPTTGEVQVYNETIVERYESVNANLDMNSAPYEGAKKYRDLKGDSLYMNPVKQTEFNITGEYSDNNIHNEVDVDDDVSDLQDVHPTATSPSSAVPGDGWYTVDTSGDFGVHSDIAIDSNANIHICYYDGVSKDLKYANKVNGEWIIHLVDYSKDVGKYSRMDLDSSGNPHIVYYDGTDGDLKYAYYDGDWSTEIIDRAGDVGQYADIVIDSGDIPHISYYDNTSGDLKYATIDSNEWVNETVEQKDDIGQYTSITVDGGDDPHISYYGVTKTDLRYIEYSGSSWGTPMVVEGIGITGLYTSIQTGNDNRARISYYDLTNGNLKYARYDGMAWNIQTVDGDYPGIDVGGHTSLVLDSSGQPHITYVNSSTNIMLKYTHYNGASWVTQTIDAGPNDVGLYNSIVLDGDDNPQISYNDHTDQTLNFQRYYGSWLKETINQNKGRVMALSEFDTGDTGGWLKSVALNIRYSVNDDNGDLSEWQRKPIKLINAEGEIVPLSLTPDAGDNDIFVSINISESSKADKVKDIKDIKILYDMNYTGSLPGPSVNFDYINVEYKYNPYLDIYGKRYIKNETAVLGPTSSDYNHSITNIPMYQLTGKVLVYNKSNRTYFNSHDNQYLTVFEGDETDQVNSTFNFTQHHLKEVKIYFINKIGFRTEWDEDNYTLDTFNGSIRLDVDIPKNTYVVADYEWTFNEGGMAIKEVVFEGSDKIEKGKTFDTNKKFIKNVAVYYRENQGQPYSIYPESNYKLNATAGNITLLTEIPEDMEIAMDYEWHYLTGGRKADENVFVGNESDESNKDYQLIKYPMLNESVYIEYEDGTVEEIDKQGNYTIDYQTGILTPLIDIPDNANFNITYDWYFFGFDRRFTIDQSTGEFTYINKASFNAKISITYQCYRKWEKNRYTVNKNKGEVELYSSVRDYEQLFASYSCGKGLITLGVKVPKAQYPANNTFGHRHIRAPYNITGLPFKSQSGWYKFGVSKSNHLADIWEHNVGMLLVDSKVPGVYDQIFVDIDNDFDFGEEKPVNKSSPLAFTEIKSFGGKPGPTSKYITMYDYGWKGNKAEDADIGLSAGLLYWMSNGDDPLPYSERFVEIFDYDINVTIPKNGDLVAFYDDWATHGTSTAAFAAGSGRSYHPYLFENTAYPELSHRLSDLTGLGTAPGAKVIGISLFEPGSSGITTEACWRFAGEGYDGVPDTGDEADVSSNSWGSNVGNSGWFYYDRLAMNMTKDYPHTTIVVSAGNEGNGYGTVSSPGSSPAVITAGGGTHMAYEDYMGNDLDPLQSRNEDVFPFEIGDGDPLNTRPYGDFSGVSSKGPNKIGQPGIDVYAADSFSMGPLPINYPFITSHETTTVGETNDGWHLWSITSQVVLGLEIPFNNSHPFALFSGTSMSSPLIAGVCALTHQAYEDTNNEAPTTDRMKNIIMSSADEMGFDPLQQGAGWINGTMAVKMALGQDGVEPDVDFWSPGGYDGQSHRGMVNLMKPNESDTLRVNLDNHGGYNISDSSHMTDETILNMSETTIPGGNYDLNGYNIDKSSFVLEDEIFIDNETIFDQPTAADEDRSIEYLPEYSLVGSIKVYNKSKLWDPSNYSINLISGTFENLVDIGVNTIINLTYAGVREWNESEYHLNEMNGDITFNNTVGNNQTITASYSYSDVVPVVYEKTNDFTFRFDRSICQGVVTMTKDAVYGRTGKDMLNTTIMHDTSDNILDKALNSTGFLKITAVQGKPRNAYMQVYDWQDEWQEMLDPDHIANWDKNDSAGNGILDGRKGSGRDEEIRMTWAMDKSLYLTTYIRNPRDRIHDGLVIESTTAGLELNGTIHIEVYEKAEWDWMDITNVSNNGFDAKINVPADAGVGGYQGGIIYNWGNSRSLIPIFVNVMGQPTKQDGVMHFGGGEMDTGLYSNNRIGAHKTYYDSRIFFLDYDMLFPPQDNDHYISIIDFLGNKSTMVMNVYAESPAIYSGGEYGPFGMSQVSTSSVSTDPLRTMVQFENALKQNPDGLILLEVRNKGVGSGMVFGEKLNGSIGHVKIWPSDFTYYNQHYGKKKINVETSMDLPGGITALTPEIESDSGVEDIQPHPIGDESDFIKYLSEAPTKMEVDVPEGAYTFNFHVWGLSDNDDYDLGIFKDGYGDNNEPDGKIDKEDFVEYCADADADEDVTVVSPEKGTYVCCVAGFTVASGQYRYEWKYYAAGESAFQAEGVSNQTLKPKTGVKDISFNLTWELPEVWENKTIESKIFVSPSVSSIALTETITPKMIFDYQKPEVNEISPADGEVINFNNPFVSIDYEDKGKSGIDVENVEMYFDNEKQIIKPTKQRVSIGTEDLSEGTHQVMVILSDNASNMIKKEWTFFVDTEKPFLDITQPMESGTATNSDIYEFKGTVEEGAKVYINGDNVPLSGKEFTYSAPLEGDENVFTITAEDTAGNFYETTKSIIYDTDNPNVKGSTPVSRSIVTRDSFITFDGQVSDDEYPDRATVKIDGEEVNVYSDGAFSHVVELEEGENEIVREVTDIAGNTRSDTYEITKDTSIKDFKISSIEKVDKDTVKITGTVEEDGDVWINGRPVLVSQGGFTGELDIVPSRNNEVIVYAEDEAGNSQQISRTYDASTEEEGTISDYMGYIAGIAVAAIVIGLIIGLVMSKFFLGGKDEELPEEEEPEEIEETEELDETEETEPLEEEESLEQEDMEEDIEDEPEEDIFEEDEEEEATLEGSENADGSENEEMEGSETSKEEPETDEEEQ